MNRCKKLSVLMMFLSIFSFDPVIAQSEVPVYVAKVEQTHFSDEVEALGTLKANENVGLTSTVTELVVNINFDDGQRVRKGQVLVEMDAQQERAELAEEVSRRDEARKQVDRLNPLIERGAASKSLLDEWRREVQTAEARLAAVQARIDERIIKAPFDGVVGLRNISVGAIIQPGTLITTLDDDSVMKLDFSVPEVFLSALKPGLHITANARAFPDDVFQGVVASIDSRVDPVTRSVLVRALLPNPERKLKPGMLMRVELLKNPRDTLVVPEESVLLDGEKHYVFVIDSDAGKTIAQRRDVEIGSRRKGDVEITAGLQMNDRVITDGTLRVRSGTVVRIDATKKTGQSVETLFQQGAHSTTP